MTKHELRIYNKIILKSNGFMRKQLYLQLLNVKWQHKTIQVEFDYCVKPFLWKPTVVNSNYTYICVRKPIVNFFAQKINYSNGETIKISLSFHKTKKPKKNKTIVLGQLFQGTNKYCIKRYSGLMCRM